MAKFPIHYVRIPILLIVFFIFNSPSPRCGELTSSIIKQELDCTHSALNLNSSYFYSKKANILPNREYNPGRRVWGGLFLAAGTGCTIYGFLERGIYFSQKSIYREESVNDNTVSEQHFTVYKWRHGNPHTALLTSIGLFLNGTYWVLKERVDGIDLEDYSLVFSERKMAWYSIIFGSLVVTSSFLTPEYVDEVRRGYEKLSVNDGSYSYFPIQDERREYSYRQASVNASAGLVYIGFGIWKLFDNSPNPSKTTTSQQYATRTVSVLPMITPAGFYVSFYF